MRTHHGLAAAALAGLWACVQPNRPELGNGRLSLQFQGSAATAWDSVKVFVRGATNRTVNVTPGRTVTIDRLIPGTYTVALEAFDSGGVASFFQTSNVNVAASANTSLTPAATQFASFVPTMSALPSTATSTTFMVSFGSVPDAASYELEAATNQTFAANRVAVATTTTSTPVTVPTYGTYYVRVRAIDAYQGRGRACPFQTIRLTSLPGDPGGLIATDVSNKQINLSWIDNATDEEGFRIERCSGAGCTNFTQIAAVGANITGYQNSGLTASTSYSYRVRAYNSAGNSGYSNVASATTRH
jgi:PKD repeat protein